VPPAFKRAESETEEYSEDDLGSDDDDEDIDATSDLEESAFVPLSVSLAPFNSL
jgi:hypothetical protein